MKPLKKVFFYFAGSVLLAAALAGCAGLPGAGGIAPAGGGAGIPSQAEVKLMEANRALDSVNEQASAFYGQLNSLIAEINELRSRPYWSEFEQILLEFPSLRDPDSQAEMTGEMQSRLSEWSRKWKTPWEKTLEDYLRLVDKCAILEARRLAAKERLLSVQARYVAVVLMESSAGHEKQGREVYAVVEALDKSGAELDSYQPDDLGLYAGGAGR
jgi:hypothetical protein